MSLDIKKNNIRSKNRYRPEIDGLRAFAVTTVIINHFNKVILPSGYLGVDIFFVISGFVITSSLYQRPSKNFKDFISGFYERRIKRLVPALSVFVLIMSIAICLFSPEPRIILKTGLSSLFGLSNIFLFIRSTDYFAQSTELNVFTHTWSLGVEEQFYILFPFLIWFSGFGRQTKNGTRNLFLIVIALTIASLIGFIYLYPLNQSAAYFLMTSRFWEMASGCLLFIGLQKRKSIEQLLEKVPPLLLLTLIIGVMYLPMSFATTSTVLVVALTLVLIISLKRRTGTFAFFTNPKVVYVGQISYSLYLWHWGILSISRWTIGIHWWSIPFQFALMWGLAIASYRYIETPLRKGESFGKRWKTFAIGGGVLVSIAAVLVTLGKPLTGKLYSGKQFNKWKMDISRYYANHTFIINNPTLPSIYLIGDSNAGTYTKVMKNLVKTKEYNLVIHTMGKGLKLKEKTNQQWILEVRRKYTKNFKKGDIIIFAGDIDKYTNKQNWTKYYDNFIQQTKNIELKFILISPTPTFSKEIKFGYTCQEEWYRPSWAISPLCFGKIKKNEWFSYNNVPISNVKKFLLENPKVSYIDTFSILCPSNYCKNHDQLSLMYKDTNHLNSYGAMKVRNAIETLIRSK